MTENPTAENPMTENPTAENPTAENPTAENPTAGKPSGLRNPQAAVRGVGAGALGIEALVLLLAIAPLHMLGVRHWPAAIVTVVVLAVACIVLAGALRRAWAWQAALVPQVVLLACAYFTLALAILGVLFALVWIYVLTVRRSVLGAGR